MDHSLQVLCSSLKKILSHLKPEHNAISFLLLTGKLQQGKTSLLRQTTLTHYPIASEINANFFYNNHGIILELGEAWLTQSDNLLAVSLKQLNRCCKITGMILCLDSYELLLSESSLLIDTCKAHTQLLERFAYSLGHKINVSILLTKLDTVVGFCEFFQSEHEHDLRQALGFSLTSTSQRKQLLAQYRQQFDHMIEVLGQRIINKLHPERSSIKRTLIREFPLQLVNLRMPLQLLLQNLSMQFCNLQSIYFTSAEQGGASIDKLNKKIQHEYTLAIQDGFSQANNYRAYFIDGAIKSLQKYNKYRIVAASPTQKWLGALTASVMSVAIVWIVQQYMRTSRLLDDVSKELITFETISGQSQDKASALFHLSNATLKLQQTSLSLSLPGVEQLKNQLAINTKQKLSNDFLPQLLAQIEQVLSNPQQTQVARYQALKVYLMLGEPEHFSQAAIINWFKNSWQAENINNNRQKELMLLQSVLQQPMQPIAINRQLVSDVRNYLNALPLTYLYYTLAKPFFPLEKQPITINGFELASKELPYYYTKDGFSKTIAAIPNMATRLQEENWVLARQDLQDLPQQLAQAYCFDYITWWHNFIKHSKPLHYLNYTLGQQLTHTLYVSDAIAKLLRVIQENTALDSKPNYALFNQKIANEFTSLNLISASTVQEITRHINELEKLLTTLSLVHDDGRTVFNLTTASFKNGSTIDPLNSLYSKAQQLPPPVATWVKQIADDLLVIFIENSKQYLNQQWRNTVYQEYTGAIAGRYPIDATQQNNEIAIADFEHFFAPSGTLNIFVERYLKPFLDISTPQWHPKEVKGYIMPIPNEIIDELMRANVIANMFFFASPSRSKIEFSLQKITLDPVVANFALAIGTSALKDNQSSESLTQFSWPQNDAKLSLDSIDGNHYELAETGPWAFFKILQKVNVLVDNEDSSSLQILFEVNGNSGRYLLKTQNQINPFSPGILTGFHLQEVLL